MESNCKIFLGLLVIVLTSCSDRSNIRLDLPQGIWIATDFYKSFEESNSMVMSKDAFHSSNPVALRINHDELNGNVLNVGYSVLHSHVVSPEISHYTVNSKKDTVYEQGSFRVDLTQYSKEGAFETSEIYPFSYEWKSSISYNHESDRIELFRPKNERYDAISIEYIRVDSTFETNYKYPNPLYYYTRKTLLIGSYVIKDTLGNVVSSELNINTNGEMRGMKEFEGNSIFYSTDVYCGGPVYHDLVLIGEDVMKEEPRIGAYGFRVMGNGNLELCENRVHEIKGGKVIYILERQ